MSEVKLALYDLSHGMAGTLSAQLLGPDHVIDIIPHTGILAFGKEYFFGGGGPGIGADDPNYFRTTRGIQPIQIIPLGQTTIKKEQFEAWCHAQINSRRYHGESYDLLQNNCNNFSHDAAKEGLKLSQGVPQWILDVPARVLASPMGQIIKPMLDNMQLTGGGGVIPAASQPLDDPRQQDASYNPWANISSPKTVPATPILDSKNRPLLSNDTNTVSICVKKLVSSCPLDADKATLESLQIALSNACEIKPSNDIIERGCMVIYKHLVEDPANLLFSLMLLRLVVLYPPTTYSTKCLHWVQSQLKLNGTSLLSTPASRSMAWCTISNAYSSNPDDEEDLEGICEAALGDIVKYQPLGVRKSASAFLYNVALNQSPLMADEDVVPDLLVSLLCGSLEGLDTEEPDPSTTLHRLMCAARLVKSDVGINIAAKRLMVDSEFDDVVRALVSSGDEQVTPLAAELLALLES